MTEKPPTLEIVDLVIKGVGFGVTAISLWITSRQLLIANLWKRKEFANKSITEFFQNPLVRNAMLMLDWRERKLVLSEEHSRMTGEEAFDYSEDLLTNALREGLGFTDEEVVIRDCFDAFFGGIQQFNDLVESRLMQYSDFKPYFVYWGKLLQGKIDHKSTESLNAIHSYIKIFFDAAQINEFFQQVMGDTQVEVTRRNDVAA